MLSRRWSVSVLFKYALFQLPEIAVLVVVLFVLENWGIIPKWSVYAIIAAWIAKDALLYPFVWKAYDFEGGEYANSMIGKIGYVKDGLAPSGMISVRGELWKARVAMGESTIEKGRYVRIVAIEGLTLVVEPERKGECAIRPEIDE
jgi:membrane-bound ClpP family serine protease